MRILLTANASYDPPKGGSTRSNLVWLQHLAANGHQCRVVSAGSVPTNVAGVEIRPVEDLSRNASAIRAHIQEFQPEWVLVSSEDVSHTLLREAFAAAPDRLVYLAHTPQWYPFGPASWHQDERATAIVRAARGIVAIGQTTARYIKEYCGCEAAVVHPPIYGKPPFRRMGSFGGGSVLMINPSAVKGIGIFLRLADRFPDTPFAGLAGWGTTAADREAMRSRPNISVLETVPDIEDVLAQARLLLMPSVWFEGFGLIAMEAMLRGVPVVSSDAGGLVEAKEGTGYVIPVRPIEAFESSFDETLMPRAIVPPQDIEPWASALHTLLTDKAAYWAESERSREAALRFVSGLRASDFEDFLLRLSHGEPAAAVTRESSPLDRLSPEKRALLMRRLRSRT